MIFVGLFISLGYNGITDDATKELANCLKKNKILTFINIGNNGITNKGAIKLLSDVNKLIGIDLSKSFCYLIADNPIENAADIFDLAEKRGIKVMLRYSKSFS